MDEKHSSNKCMRAAFTWLCYKAFEGNVPEEFQNLFVLHELRLQPIPRLITSLIKCHLYDKACSVLFNEPNHPEDWSSHINVLDNLARRGIRCRDANDVDVVAEALQQDNPFSTECHIALIECIMTLHCSTLAPPTNVMSTLRSLHCVDTYGSYTSADALEKWMLEICRKLFQDIVPKSGTRGAHLSTLVHDDENEFLASLSVAAQTLLVLHHYSPSAITLQEVEDIILDRNFPANSPRSSSSGRNTTLVDLLLADKLTQFAQQLFTHRVIFVEREDLGLPLREQSVQHIQQHVILLIAEFFHHLVGKAMNRVSRLLSQSMRSSTTNGPSDDSSISSAGSGFRLLQRPSLPQVEPRTNAGNGEKGNGFYLQQSTTTGASEPRHIIQLAKPKVDKHSDRSSVISTSEEDYTTPDDEQLPPFPQSVSPGPEQDGRASNGSNTTTNTPEVPHVQPESNNSPVEDNAPQLIHNNNNHLSSFAVHPRRVNAEKVAPPADGLVNKPPLGSLKSQFQNKKKELQEQKNAPKVSEPSGSSGALSPTKTSWLKQKTEEENRRKDAEGGGSSRSSSQSRPPSEDVSQLSDIKIRLAQKKQLIAKNKADQKQREVEIIQQRKKQAFLQSLGKVPPSSGSTAMVNEEKENENQKVTTLQSDNAATKSSVPSDDSFTLHSSTTVSHAPLAALMRQRKDTPPEVSSGGDVNPTASQATSAQPPPTGPGYPPALLALKGVQFQEYSSSLDRLNTSLSDLQHEISQLSIQQQLIHQNMWEKMRVAAQPSPAGGSGAVGGIDSSVDLSSSTSTGSLTNRATWGERSILVDITPGEEEANNFAETVESLSPPGGDSDRQETLTRSKVTLSSSTSGSVLTQVSPRPTTWTVPKSLQASSDAGGSSSVYMDPVHSFNSSQQSEPPSVVRRGATQKSTVISGRKSVTSSQQPLLELDQEDEKEDPSSKNAFFINLDDGSTSPARRHPGKATAHPPRRPLSTVKTPTSTTSTTSGLRDHVLRETTLLGHKKEDSSSEKKKLDVGREEDDDEELSPTTTGTPFQVVVIEDQDPQELERKRQRILEQHARRAAEREKTRLRLEAEKAERLAQLRMEEQLKEEKRMAERAKRESILQAYLDKKGQDDEAGGYRSPHSAHPNFGGNASRQAVGGSNFTQFTIPATPGGAPGGIHHRSTPIRSSKRPKSMHSLATTKQQQQQSALSSSTSRSRGTSRSNLAQPASNQSSSNGLPTVGTTGGDDADGVEEQRTEGEGAPAVSSGPRAVTGGGGGPSEYLGPKLYVQPRGKSNRTVIHNAIAHCCLAGVVNAPLKDLILKELASAEGSHFMVLFRDARCQYRALYTFDQEVEEMHLICGTGPRRITHEMVDKFFKYNSGSKQFSLIASTNHLSTVVDAITIKAQFWKASTSTTPSSGMGEQSMSSTGNLSSNATNSRSARR